MPMIANTNPVLTYNLSDIFFLMFTFKFIMLFIFFVLMESIFGYFLYITNQLNSRLEMAIQNNAVSLQNLENYSEHFK